MVHRTSRSGLQSHLNQRARGRLGQARGESVCKTLPALGTPALTKLVLLRRDERSHAGAVEDRCSSSSPSVHPQVALTSLGRGVERQALTEQGTHAVYPGLLDTRAAERALKGFALDRCRPLSCMVVHVGSSTFGRPAFS